MGRTSSTPNVGHVGGKVEDPTSVLGSQQAYVVTLPMSILSVLQSTSQ